jgi:hypothetical protein
MGNTNTTGIGYYNMPAYVALTGTAVQKIPWCYNSTPVFANQSATTPSALQVAVDPDLVGGTFDGHAFKVRFNGSAQVVTTAQVTVGLYNDTSMTATSGNLVGALTASTSTTGAATGAFVDFYYEALLQWNSKTLQVTGTFSGFSGGISGGTANAIVINAQTAATNHLVSAAGAVGPAGFSIGITYSAANTGSLVYINEISVERV